VDPTRHFIREGSFVKFNNHGKPQSRHMILFSDVLIYMKPQVVGNGKSGDLVRDSLRGKQSTNLKA
jgi:hypothetical protein